MYICFLDYFNSLIYLFTMKTILYNFLFHDRYYINNDSLISISKYLSITFL